MSNTCVAFSEDNYCFALLRSCWRTYL